MRNLILVIALGIFILCSLIVGFGIVKKFQSNKKQIEKISFLPSFIFSKLNFKAFNSAEIKTGPVLIMHFHPECEHCQFEISEVLKNDALEMLASVILVSSAHPDSIRSFLNQFNCTGYSNVIPLVDTSNTFGEIFGSETIPSNYIYDKDLRLVKIFYGEVKSEAIFKYLQRIE